MIRQEEELDPNSTWNKSAPGEPLFILRGNDELAPKTIRDWACRLLDQSNFTKANGSEGLAKLQRDKAAQAFEAAGAFEAWQIINGKKVPD